MDLPRDVIAALCVLIPRQTITVRERRRLSILHRLCSVNRRQAALSLGHTARTVRRWCRRAVRLVECLSESDRCYSEGELQKLLLATVADAPRAGAPPVYTPEQQCGIVALAVRKPADFGLPVEQWSHRELALVAGRAGIVSKISRRTVGRILAEADLKPHRIKYWLNPVIDDQEAHDAAVAHICDLYRNASTALRRGKHTVCIDEKTGIQALERIHPDKPIRPGKPALLEFEYRRHGTQALIPTFEVGTGRILVAHIGPTRTEADFAAVVEATADTDPDAEWTFIADQLNTHRSETLVRLPATRQTIIPSASSERPL